MRLPLVGANRYRLLSPPLAFSAILNTMMLVVMLFATDVHYATNDDYGLAKIIPSYGYCYYNYTNFFLNNILVAIQRLLPYFNAWTICQMAFCFLANCATLYVFLDGKAHVWVKCLGVVAVFLYTYDAYAAFQFTQTAAIAMVSGFLLLAHTVLAGNRTVGIWCGFALVAIGSGYRFSGFWAAGAFFLVAMATWFFFYRGKELAGRLARVGSPRVVLVAALFVAVVSGHQVSNVIDNSTPDLKYYYEYNSARAAFMDYPKPDYAENREAFEVLGISENDYRVLKSWGLDFNGVASLENLNAIRVIKREEMPRVTLGAALKSFLNQSVNDVKAVDSTALHFIFNIGLMAVGIVFLKRRGRLGIVVQNVLALCLYLYLHTVGRPAYRAMFLMDVSVSLWSVYFLCVGCAVTVGASVTAGGTAMRVKGRNVAIALTLVAIVWLSWYFAASDREHYPVQKSEVSEQLWERVTSHPDDIFMMDNDTLAELRKTEPYYTNPLKYMPKGFDKNIAGFGGWSVMSPLWLSIAESNGLTNYYGDIVNNEHVFMVLIGDISMWEQYYNDHYAPEGEEVRFVEVDNIGDYIFYEVRTFPVP